MQVFRPLFLSLSIALCVSSLAAQSSTDKPVASDSKDDSQSEIPKDLARQRILTLEENWPVCYTLRTYRVVRETPDSDSTRPASYSTCQRASRFQFKTAVDSREIAPR